MAAENDGLEHAFSSSSSSSSASSTAPIAFGSLRTKENVYLLALLLVLTLWYFGHQAIQRRNSERKAFQRKARLLGIQSWALATSSSAGSSLASSSSLSSSGATASPGATAANDSSVASSIRKHIRVLAHQAHLDACLLYMTGLLTPFVKRFAKSKGGRDAARRRKSTSNAASDTTSANGSATSVKDVKNRANTNTSSPSQSSNASQSKTSSSNDKNPNGSHVPAGSQTRSLSRPNGPSRHTSSNTPSPSSSRSRSATQSTRQQQQQRTSSLSSSHVSAAQEVKPVMKSIGIQVGESDLLQAAISASPAACQSRNVHAHPATRKGKTTDGSSTSSMQLRACNTPDRTMPSPRMHEEGALASKSDFEIACNVPLPVDPSPAEEDELSPNVRLEVSTEERGLKRDRTITSRTSRSTSRSAASQGTAAQPPTSLENAAKQGSASNAQAMESPKMESLAQSPTGSSSGRSASLSVSTDATGLTSLHGGEPDMKTVPEEEEVKLATRSNIQEDRILNQLQPPVDLKETATSGQTPKKPIPNGLQYSFHTGFQEPTTLENDADDPTDDLMRAHHSLHQSDGNLYLPSPPDSQRRIRVDALGYPSMPLPPSSSSANSSANNSPSAARRAVPVSRPPSALSGSQSPAQERKPSKASLNGSAQVDSGMYLNSIGLQSTNAFPSLPTSPPTRLNGGDYRGQPTSPYHLDHAAQSGVFSGPPLADPQSSQQPSQVPQYMAQTQYQYQNLLQPQAQQPSLNAHLHPSLQVHLPQQPIHQGFQSPVMLSTATSAASPGLLNPLQVHVHANAGSSGGGSGRSSVHQSHHSASSRSASPHPSNQSTTSYSTEPSSVAYTDGAPSRLQSSMCSPGPQPAQVAQQQSQYLQQVRQQQQQPPLHVHTPAHHTQSPQHLDLVQKMLLMQAQIQLALQQNEAQTQQAQAQAHSQQHHFFQSAAGIRAASASVPQTPLTAARPGLPSPLLYSDSQLGQPVFVPNGFNDASSPASGSYPSYLGASTGPHQVPAAQEHYAQLNQYVQQYQSPTASTSKSYMDCANELPSIRRRQSTPALGADMSTATFNASQAQASGSPYMSGKRRNRRHSKPFRLSSYGQAASLDSPDFLASPANDTSAQYDAEVDLSTTSSSHTSFRPKYDRRRSSLVPPTSPLLNGRKERRNRQKERERERSRQMELDDEEVTNNEDDIKADLEVLAQMQQEEDQNGGTTHASLTDIMKRLKSMEIVLERRGKELEIAKWKLKCVEVDRRSIEAEHQKALTHFYERAERAEARLRLADSAVGTSDGSIGKGSPEVLARQVQDATSLQGENSVPSESSHADSESTRPPVSTSFSSTTPHLAYSAGYPSPTSFNAATYAFSDSPYTSSKYPPHPFASEYKTSRNRRKSPRIVSQSSIHEAQGNRTLSPCGNGFRPLPLRSRANSTSQTDSASSESSDSDDEDIEILLDASYSRSPIIQPSAAHSRVPSGNVLDSAASPSSALMKENKTVGLGIEPSSSSSEDNPVRKGAADYVGSLPSFTISQPPASSPSSPSTRRNK
ncbi:hypothetical protein P389DRAFT_180686 [Cystobasidium minutum MCA 4210]|uniref:uncharacterized protein n=1 Tax=Cystobasidium minutum MCA 4210 TaxID=1397322 RepID=UPI0034CFF0EA|eukprot:jgi/Rhomi1/180686/fgenesh1_pg.5_\